MQNLRPPFSASVRLVQFISDLVYADAASSDCVEFHRLFREWGCEAAIYAGRRDGHHQGIAQDCSAYRPGEHDLVVFHYTAWSAVAQYLLELGRPMVFVYHNITPPEFFGRANPAAYEATRLGIEALPRFAPLTGLALGMSEYSRKQLTEAGFERTGVIPILVDFGRLDGKPNPEILKDYDDDYVNFLFVGRVDPNKKQEDLVKVLYHYQRACNPKSRLFLVGAHTAGGPYHAWIQALIDHLGIQKDVHFTGQTSHRDLLSFYRLADVFICMSEHEGFCVPLVESMYLGLPVVAYAATGVPSTLDGAGILVKNKNYAAIAEVVHEIAGNELLRRRLVQNGRRRAAEFGRDKVGSLLGSYLAEALQNA